MNSVFCVNRFTFGGTAKSRIISARRKTTLHIRPTPSHAANDDSASVKNRIPKTLKYSTEIIQNSVFGLVKQLERKPSLTFTHIQSLAASAYIAYTLLTQPGTAGILLVVLCVSISLSGYLYSFQQSYRGGPQTPGEVYRRVCETARIEYSFKTHQNHSNQLGVMLMSPFYEPSPLYLALNCWGIYSIGQGILTPKIGSFGVLFLCVFSILVGRLFQRLLSESKEGTLEVQGSIWELLLIPKGTWGFGPLLNSLIWFSCFSFPRVLYLATPTGVLAPVWTALGVPILLLIEDLWSSISPQRRSSKSQEGNAPGLQLSAFLVGFLASLFIK